MNSTPAPVAVITQARMTSSRLPGKILMEVSGKTLLEYHLERLAHREWSLIVATTTGKTDQPVASLCAEKKILVSRGPEHDVLERFRNTIEEHGLEDYIIVRVTSDCPFIDPYLIEQGLDMFRSADTDQTYVSNCFPRTFARGFDFEICTGAMLIEAAEFSTDEFDREHVTPYIWKNRSGNVSLLNLSQQQDHSSLRLCVDTREDFELAEKLISIHHCDRMRHNEIESLLTDHPELVAINAHVEQHKLR